MRLIKNAGLGVGGRACLGIVTSCDMAFFAYFFLAFKNLGFLV